MLEAEMEDLLWGHAAKFQKFLPSDLKPFRRQLQNGSVGRSDLVFEDSVKRLLVIEVKRGKLPRSSYGQLLAYYGMLKADYPERPVEMIAIANIIPHERKLAAESLQIECIEIPERSFREIAKEVGYEFASEHLDLSSGIGKILSGFAIDVEEKLMSEVAGLSIQNTLKSSPDHEYSGIYVSRPAWKDLMSAAIESQSASGREMIFGVLKGKNLPARADFGALQMHLAGAFGKGKRSNSWCWFRYFNIPLRNISNDDFILNLSRNRADVIADYVNHLVRLVNIIDEKLVTRGSQHEKKPSL